MTATDVMDQVAGLSSDSPIAALRRQRPDFVRYTQGSHDVLLAPAEPGGVSLLERAAVALRVAAIEHDAALVTHYRHAMQQAGANDAAIAAAERGTGEATPRLAAILQHVSRIATAPRTATRAGLDALRAIGLSPQDIVVITQLVAFVSYQVRVAAGLRLLAVEMPA